MAERLVGLTRELMAMRAARELHDGEVVNLGIGLPTLVSNFLPDGAEVILQSENGIVRYGQIAEEDFDPDLINAGGQPVTLQPGASFVSSDQSFAMIRGGHIDVAILGGLQVSANGDLANWFVPERGGGSVGGAMDLAAGARRLIVLMEHGTRSGEPKLVQQCSYPLTGAHCVDLVITDLAVVAVTPEGFELREVAPGITPEDVQRLTDAPLRRSPDLREMEL